MSFLCPSPVFQVLPPAQEIAGKADLDHLAGLHTHMPRPIFISPTHLEWDGHADSAECHGGGMDMQTQLSVTKAYPEMNISGLKPPARPLPRDLFHAGTIALPVLPVLCLAFHPLDPGQALQTPAHSTVKHWERVLTLHCGTCMAAPAQEEERPPHPSWLPFPLQLCFSTAYSAPTFSPWNGGRPQPRPSQSSFSLEPLLT
jgi:hypothetical protein